MRFEKLFRYAVYLTMVSGAAVMASAEGTLLYAGLLAAACAMHAVVAERRPSFAVSRRTAALIACVAALYTLSGFGGYQPMLFSAAHLLMVLQAIKLFQQKGERDFPEQFLMSFVLAGAGAVMAEDASFGPAFVLYIFIAVPSLLLLAVRRDAHAGGAEPQISGSLIALGLSLGAACLAGAVGVFLLFPRFGPAMANYESAAGRSTAGFGETVRLRDSGSIEPNQQIVFRAALSGPAAEALAPGDMLWRGVALDYFNGHLWAIRSPGSPLNTGPQPVPFMKASAPERTLIQSIDLAPTPSRVLFGIGRVRGLLLENSDERAVIHARPHDSFLMRVPIASTLRYEVRSELPPPGEALEAPDYPLTQAARVYLQLPTLSPRVAELARKIAPDDLCPRSVDKAEAVQRYLQQNYDYSVELPGQVQSPVESFLFERRKGHCEVFASAMVVLLRTLGVPSRLVNGYCGGQWNEFLARHIVRQNNAHSWVEVYFPGLTLREGGESGLWVPFDPTPPDTGRLDEPGGLMAYMMRMRDYVNVRWTDNVILYGQSHQANIVRRFNELVIRSVSVLRATRAPNASGLIRVLGWTLSIALPAAAAAAALLLARKFLKIRIGFPGTKPIRGGTKLYRDLQRLLRRRGHRRLPGQTPLEFARHVVACEGPGWSDVEAVTRVFCAIRYSGRADRAAEADAERRLRAIRTLARGGGLAVKPQALQSS